MVSSRAVFAFALSLTLIFSVGCQNNGAKGGNYPRKETLYIGGHEWSKPNNFNPLNEWPVTWPVSGSSNLMYESLFGYNILTGELEPLLGQEWQLSDSVLSVLLNEKAYWSDGNPVLPEDVLYTFELHKKYETLHNSSWDYFDSLYYEEESGQLLFKLRSEQYNPLIMKDIIATVYILPKHVVSQWEKEGVKKAKVTFEKGGGNWKTGSKSKKALNLILDHMKSYKNNENPVVSGPYTIYEATDDKIVLKRIENYWGNDAMYSGEKPGPKYIIHPIYAENKEFNDALTRGDLDASATFCPMIEAKKSSGVGTFYESSPYYVPGSIPSLIICHKPAESKRSGYTKSVLMDATFRRACARMIDRSMIRKVAIQKYAPELKPGYIIDNDIEGLFYNESDANQYGNGYDPESAKSLLKSAGYKWKNGELVTPYNKKVDTLEIACPKGWDDWITAVDICVKGLEAGGIPVKKTIIAEEDYWGTLAYGTFDFIVKTPQAEQMPSLPWSRFDKIMAADEICGIGEWASANEGRYYNRRVDSLLTLIPKLEDEAQVEAYNELNRLFMKEMPVIPLMYRPHVFYQFNTKVWTGFPTYKELNRTGQAISPQNLNIGAAVKGLWKLKNK